ncbi:MAG: site-specific integrase [Pilosibacter sp.]
MARVQIKDQTTGSAPQGPKCFSQEQAEKFLLLLDNVQTYAYGSRSRIDTAGKIYQVSEYQSARTVALQLKFLFYLAMFTGCRRGELLALQWSDLDFDKGSVSISKSLCCPDGKKIIKPTKTNHDRSISIPQIVVTLGKQWKHEQNLYRLSIGSRWINEDNVFIRWNGDSMRA